MEKTGAGGGNKNELAQIVISDYNASVSLVHYERLNSAVGTYNIENVNVCSNNKIRQDVVLTL
jgi:hypothetical protein